VRESKKITISFKKTSRERTLSSPESLAIRNKQTARLSENIHFVQLQNIPIVWNRSDGRFWKYRNYAVAPGKSNPNFVANHSMVLRTSKSCRVARKLKPSPVATNKELRSTQTTAPDEARPANQGLPQLRPSRVDVDGFTDLHRAAFEGKLDKVIKLVNDEKEDLNAKSNDGWTPLHMAAQEGHRNVVEWLISTHKIDCNPKASKGWTPLHAASQQGKLDVVQILVTEGATAPERKVDPNAADEHGQTPLHYAALHGHSRVVAQLIAGGANPDAKNTDSGWTPLHWAAHKGELDVVKALITVGANAKARDDHNRTPISLAADRGALDVVKYLLEMNVDVDMRDNEDYTPLHGAAAAGHFLVVKSLCIDGKAKLDVKNMIGRTPLLEAIIYKHREMAIWLVSDANADVHLGDDTDWTPLHWAAYGGLLDVVECLVKIGEANVDARDEDRLTPIHLAAQEGNLDVVRWLVMEGKADANAEDKDGYTPLHLAVCVCEDTAPSLSEKVELPMNLAIKTICAPLDSAAYTDKPARDKFDTVRWLVKEGKVDVNAKNAVGKTPLHLAVAGRHYDMVVELVSWGANMDAVDNDGHTAKDIIPSGSILYMISEVCSEASVLSLPCVVR
jgi:ankyrin repeat protein